MIQDNRQTTIAVDVPQAVTLPRITAKPQEIGYNLAMLTGGALLWVLALQGFMIPANILSGGLLGIAMLSSHFYSPLDVGWMNLLLNLPLLWLGYRYVGRGFTLYSLFGIAVFSLLADLVALPFEVALHPLWASLGAGLLAGGGSALILRSAGTAGGLDILAVYLRNRFRWRVGRLVLTMNGAVLLAGGGLMGLETLFYSLLFLTILSHTIDALVRHPASAPAHTKHEPPGQSHLETIPPRSLASN